LRDFASLWLRAGQDGSALDVECELFQFGEADALQSLCDGLGCEPEVDTGSLGPRIKKFDLRGACGLREFDSQLHSTPHCTVEKLGMIGRRDDDDIARKLVDLEKQRADYSLDLTCLVRVTALLGYRIELVEEEHARAYADGGEERLKA